MAKSEQTKADAIRQALKKTDSPTHVAKMLNARGIRVTSGYVSAIKANESLKAIRSRRRRQPRKNSKPENLPLQEASDLMRRAISLVAKSGGGTNARELINTAIKIVDYVRKADHS